MAIKDETGKRYGRLLVTEYVGRSTGKTKHPRFLCLCDCGKEVVVTGTNLRQNHTTSCGCLREEKKFAALREWRDTFEPTKEVGKTYGRITVTGFAGWIQPDNAPNRISTWSCSCSCGKQVVKRVDALHDSSSCGCWFSEKIAASARTHGMTGTPTYKSWLKMRERCYSDSYTEKEYYQDLGITVCDRWLESFENFFEDMGERPEGTTLDRIDSNKGYSKDNCRWASGSIQSFNCRMFKNNSSGRTGVYICENGLYKAAIRYNGELITLGRNLSFDEACSLRSAAELKYYGWNKK